MVDHITAEFHVSRHYDLRIYVTNSMWTAFDKSDGWRRATLNNLFLFVVA